MSEQLKRIAELALKIDGLKAKLGAIAELKAATETDLNVADIEVRDEYGACYELDVDKDVIIYQDKAIFVDRAKDGLQVRRAVHVPSEPWVGDRAEQLDPVNMDDLARQITTP